ncbi:hypothetical protein L1987_65648 [Smallanthus sonchifolius]|uniref:Uncharacterized protein n=1 Tax=Smallanthus sonchifolius TaxID=185202 RepID=A0ACB9BUW7_9ASTR|nr:hypothetical protein L1987_65648 [Smallanthus sonchifolius]
MAIAAQKLVLFVVYVVANGVMLMTVSAVTDAPIFIFGDSNVDVGTNNFLERCTAKANHPYNGIDFHFSKPTGRFSNGNNIVDQIARLLGNYELSPPPFLSLLAHKISFKRHLLRGANFASGGAGIFWETGQKHFHEVITLEQQIQQLTTVRTNLTELLGSPKVVDDLLRSSIYIFNIGSNDLIEYALALAHTTDPADPKQFVVNLTQAYAAHLMNMYEVGARKFAIIGIAPLGCAPGARILNATGGCAELMNDGARLFYMSMQSLLTELSLMLKDFKYSLGNMYTVTMNVIDNPRGNGFKEVKTACCGNGTTDCNVGVNLCSNRDDFLFWDKYGQNQYMVRTSPPFTFTTSNSLYQCFKTHHSPPSSLILMAKKTRKSWFGLIRRKFFLPSPRPSETIIVLHTNNTTFSQEQPPPPPPPPSTPANITDDQVCEGSSSFNETAAATKIQACFRRHLARRAYKALRSLVKLQAVVRGAYVRRQSRIALECMHALARLQVVVRARQLQLLTCNLSSLAITTIGIELHHHRDCPLSSLSLPLSSYH